MSYSGYWKRSVFVSSLTRSALVETGEHRSPKNPGQDCAAGKKGWNPHTVGHSHTDHADGGGTSKGGSRKEGDQTAQKKRRQQHHGRSTDGRSIIYDIGNGTTGTPDRGQHTDQQQSQQNIFTVKIPFREKRSISFTLFPWISP